MLHSQQRIYPVAGQNIILQQYPTLVNTSGAQQHGGIPYSTSNNEGFNIATNSHHNFHGDPGARPLHNMG